MRSISPFRGQRPFAPSIHKAGHAPLADLKRARITTLPWVSSYFPLLVMPPGEERRLVLRRVRFYDPEKLERLAADSEAARIAGHRVVPVGFSALAGSPFRLVDELRVELVVPHESPPGRVGVCREGDRAEAKIQEEPAEHAK